MLTTSNISNINFREEAPAPKKYTTRDLGSQNAILMLRDPNASIKFQQNQEFAQNADSVATNPLKALGYKLYRTFNMIRENDQVAQNEQKQFNVIA